MLLVGDLRSHDEIVFDARASPSAMISINSSDGQRASEPAPAYASFADAYGRLQSVDVYGLENQAATLKRGEQDKAARNEADGQKTGVWTGRRYHGKFAEESERERQTEREGRGTAVTCDSHAA